MAAGPRPFEMRRNRLGDQLARVRRADFLEQALAVQQLHFRRGIVDDVHLEAAGARLGDRSAQHVVLARAPDLDLDPVAVLELGNEADHVFLRHGCVQGERALALRVGEEARRATGAFVERRRRIVLRESGCPGGAGEEEERRARQHETGKPYAGSLVLRFKYFSMSSALSASLASYSGASSICSRSFSPQYL